MTQRKEMLPAFLIIVLLMSGCDTPYVQSLRKDPSVQAFFSKPPREHLDDLKGYEIEQQYAIFMYGNQARHPPLRFLAGPLVAKGEEAATLLRDKLRESDEVTTHYIVVLLEEIAAQGTYDVAGDGTLMGLVDQAVSRISDKNYRKFTQGIVQEIKKRNEAITVERVQTVGPGGSPSR